MKEARYMRQRGFLAILAVILIVIIAFIGITAVYQTTENSLTTTYQSKSSQAFYIAIGGLFGAESALATGVSCNGYSSGALSLGNGQYNVSGVVTKATSALNSNLNNSAVTISLNSTQGFASKGVVLIDAELISYGALSGNNLTNVVRGAGGTTATSHLSGAAVSENQCSLTSRGSVPTIAAPLETRILFALLTGANFSVSVSGSGYAIPTMIGLQGITASGNTTVTNSGATLNSANYPGSTIYTAGAVTLSGSAATKVNDGSGGWVTSSTQSNFKPDIVQNSTVINSSNLASQFFSQPLSTIEANAVQTYNSSNINGAHGQTIYINNGLTLSGNTTIGTANSPVILIVNGNFTVSGTTVINGFLYVTNGSIVSSGNLILNGALASTGSIVMSGNSTLNLSPPILTQLSIINSNTVTNYSNIPIFLQEIVQ